MRRGFSPDTFYGAYLDNGLGSFITVETARLLAADKALRNLRVQFGIAAYEEIGRFGSRVFAGELRPDVVIGVDVDHDYRAAPGIGEQRQTPLTIGKGFTLSAGSITSDFLHRQVAEAAKDRDIPLQLSPSGRDTGTDAMAGVLASVDAAAASIGIPVRNMHTISEIGHTGDVLAAIHALHELLRRLDGLNHGRGVSRDDFRNGHARLDRVKPLATIRE